MAFFLLLMAMTHSQMCPLSLLILLLHRIFPILSLQQLHPLWCIPSTLEALSWLACSLSRVEMPV